jgi:hypothetical protein
MIRHGILGGLGGLALLCCALAAPASDFAVAQTAWRTQPASQPAAQPETLPAPTPLPGAGTPVSDAAPTVPYPLPVDGGAAPGGCCGDGGPDGGFVWTPMMFGDLIGIFGGQVLTFPNGIPSAISSQTQVVSGNTIRVLAPVQNAASFKIAENESARPLDRFFFAYNYYNSLQRSITGFNDQAPHTDLHRETLGFEKTFLNGDASFGVRLPIQQLVSAPGIGDADLGDISVILKYAFINDRPSGNVLSTGLVTTLPTGGMTTLTGESPIGPVIFQPYLGYIYNWEAVYVQGFSAVAVPTDFRVPTLWFNDVSAGWWAYRNPAADCLTAVIPVAELHVNTPLTHRGSTTGGPIGFPDTFNVTGGCYFQFHKAMLGIAVGTPLSGPKPYDLEVLANFNMRF